MANEFQQLPNPDNVPGLVSKGYQRQNTNMYAIQTGLDTTEPYDDGEGNIVIPAGGVVELNGAMFKLTVDVTLPIPSPLFNPKWIAVTDNGDGVGGAPSTATAVLVDKPGTWDSGKQGCYLPDGRRTLNFVMWPSAEVSALHADVTLTQVFYANSQTTGSAVYLRPGWYHLHLESGKGGGNGSAGSAGSQANGAGIGGVGGVPTAYKAANAIFFDDGKKAHRLKIGANGANGGNGANGSNRAGGGGGGGSGGGDESRFDDISTGFVNPGNGAGGGRGADSGTISGGAAGAGGTLGGPARDGTNGGNSQTSAGGDGGQAGCTQGGCSGSPGGGGGGAASLPSGIGGKGGDGGLDGAMRSQGPPSGLCRIMRIE